jgi:hypothetical protein
MRYIETINKWHIEYVLYQGLLNSLHCALSKHHFVILMQATIFLAILSPRGIMYHSHFGICIGSFAFFIDNASL